MPSSSIQSAVMPVELAPDGRPERHGTPLRVLQVYKSWVPETYGGVEQTITTIGTGAQAYGITSRVLFLGAGTAVRRVRYRGLQGFRFPLDLTLASTGISLSLPLAYRRLADWADIVHFHFPWPYGDLVHLLTGAGKPLIVTYHLDITRQRLLRWLYAPIMRRFLRGADLIVATSANMVQTSAALRPLRHKTTVIPLGIEDVHGAAAVPLRTALWRQRLGEGFVLFVGVLRHYKGLQYLLEAAPAIHGRIVIAGTGPCARALREQAAGAQLSNVTFLGAVDDLDKHALYHLCQVFAFPSHLRSEGYGLALVEAAMHGKPMVSCEIGTGTSFVNQHGETGYVVEPRRPDAFAEAVNRLLLNSEERERLGRNARARYSARFTAPAMTAAYAEAYRQVLVRRGRCPS
ncbi:MAG TPA: glycosyltransferase [Nitrospira sp.]|nr:glycosyltransferase [Nitrospira sp.]